MTKKRTSVARAAARAVPKVAILIETSNSYARGLMRGIVAYMREHRPWSIYMSETNRGDRLPVWLGQWDGDGAIARIENKPIARAMASLSIPVVDVSAARLIPSLPWVETDDEAIARLAAEHLLERGLRQFGFCGDEQFNWSKWRAESFAHLIGEAGHPCSVYRPLRGHAAESERQIEHIADWIATLAKPAGVLACYDFRGREVLDACRRRGICVPDEVAVLGVDNDDLLCDLTDPPLSSVILNPRRTGYEAAGMLDRMLAGESVGPEKHAIAPLGIATRQSTEMMAIDDPDVSAVLRYIRAARLRRHRRERRVGRRAPVAAPAGILLQEALGTHATRGDRPGAVEPGEVAPDGIGPVAGEDRALGRVRVRRVSQRASSTRSSACRPATTAGSTGARIGRRTGNPPML